MSAERESRNETPDLRVPTDATMDWLASLPSGKLVNVLRDAGRISHRPEDMSMLAQLIERIRLTRSETPLRLWQTRVDCWYEAHRSPAEKPKPAQRVVAVIVHEAPDSETAIKRAIQWADDTAPRSLGRKLLSVEHRSTGPVTLPMEVPHAER